MNRILAGCGAFAAGALFLRLATKRVFVEDMEWRFSNGTQLGAMHTPVETLKDRIKESSRHDKVSLRAVVQKSNFRDLMKERPAIQTTISIQSDPNRERYWENRLWANVQREAAFVQLECMEACNNQSDFEKCCRESDLSAAVDKTFAVMSREIKTLDCDSDDAYCLDLKKRLEERK